MPVLNWIPAAGVVFSIFLGLIGAGLNRSLRRHEIFVAGIVLISFVNFDERLVHPLSLLCFSVFLRNLSYSSLLYFVNGVIFGYSLLISWGVIEILLGVPRDQIVNGLTAVIIGRYIVAVVGLSLFVYPRASMKLQYVALSACTLMAAKAAVLAMLFLIFRKRLWVFVRLSPIGLALLASVLVFFIGWWWPLLFELDFPSTLASMANRFTIFQGALDQFRSASVVEILFGLHAFVSSHFAPFDLIVSYGLVGLVVCLFGLFSAGSNSRKCIDFYGLSFCMIFLSSMSGGVWALKESIILLMIVAAIRRVGRERGIRSPKVVGCVQRGVSEP